MAYFKLHATTSGRFFFTLHGVDGCVVLTSMIHRSRESACDLISEVHAGAREPGRYETRRTVEGMNYLVFKSLDGKVFAVGERHHPGAGWDAAQKTIMEAAACTEIRETPCI